VEDRCAEAIRGLSLGCPSIYPNLRYRLVLLHERCAYLDGILLLQELKLKRQPPEAGFGWVTMFWILAFSAVTTPRRVFGSTDFNLSPIRSSTNSVALSPLAPMPVRENRASAVGFGVSGPQCSR
jgi:hypothetical protein